VGSTLAPWSVPIDTEGL